MSRPIGSLIKENSVLIAGIILPLLLIVLFYIAKTIPEKTVPSPEYRAVFATLPYPYQQMLKFKVENQKLNISYTPVKDQPFNNAQPPKIFIYDGTNDRLETIKLDAPSGGATNINVSKFQDLKLTDEETAPDGYTFKKTGYRNSSLLTEVFSYGNRSTPNSLTKDGRTIIIDLPERFYGETVFIGWVLK